MKNKFFAWLIGFIFLTGCAVTPTTSPSQVSPSLAPSPSPTLSFTTTPKPTLTPTLSPTSTSTPRPQPTATFNAALAIKRTPEPPAQCPKENPSLVPTFVLPKGFTPDLDFEQAILDFLNSGGTRRAIINYLQKQIREEALFEKDLTNDGVPELIVGEKRLRIYTCKDGKYYTAADLQDWLFVPPLVASIKDMNLDGLPEIIIQRHEPIYYPASVSITLQYQILEWDGEKFQNLVKIEERGTYKPYDNSGWWIEQYGKTSDWQTRKTPTMNILDVDHNGTLELVWEGGVPFGTYDFTNGTPWRTQISIYMWNGKNFVLQSLEYESPKFRFEATQDGDRAILNNKYDMALKFYQQAITDDKLDWWSAERQKYETDLAMREYDSSYPIPLKPSPDPNERENLAAYARYRIMLLYALQGKNIEAQAAYKTIQEKHPRGQLGFAYADIGAAFWNEYQSSQQIDRACNQAIEYAKNHPTEILYYIGAQHHNSQSLRYTPEDICPFK